MQRYSQLPFPAYRHRLDETPHPTRHPQGHSYGATETPVAVFSTATWQNCQPYLYGIDLFNHGYYWEAHAAFEQVWLAVGRETVSGLFFQGLIQIAAGYLKLAAGEPDNAKTLVELGIEKLPHQDDYCGLSLLPFARRVLSGLEDTRTPPAIVLDRDKQAST